MSVTGAIALSSSSIYNEQTTTATLTLTNGAAVDVLVTGIAPTCVPNGLTGQTTSVALGQPVWGGGFNMTVVASSTAKFSWGVTPHAPTSGQGLAEPASYVYTIGAITTLSDGSLVSATTANVTVTNLSLGAST